MKNQKKEIKILYVDDEIENLNAFKATFRRDYTIHVATSAEEGRKILDNNKKVLPFFVNSMFTLLFI